MQDAPDIRCVEVREVAELVPLWLLLVVHVQHHEFALGCPARESLHVRQHVVSPSSPDPTLIQPDSFRVGSIHGSICSCCMGKCLGIYRYVRGMGPICALGWIGCLWIGYLRLSPWGVPGARFHVEVAIGLVPVVRAKIFDELAHVHISDLPEKRVARVDPREVLRWVARHVGVRVHGAQLGRDVALERREHPYHTDRSHA
mmetsp:Transcript_1336/g.2533  ORF Transcript_1336/g.2533 Transcript_1336/m.2533 type:complete len:201 (-) Transcript_1336:738-1340(-)